jgi:phenylpyruvate tautomerase PptA (4-oxalocrotonate tautomerase family)
MAELSFEAVPALGVVDDLDQFSAAASSALLSRGTVLDVALARIEILEGRNADEQRKLVDAVAAALSEALKAPAADPSVRLIEYPPTRFSIPYPDRHSDLFTLVEVTRFAGRSMDTKRRLYQAIIDGLIALEVPRDDILIVLHEPPMHNWGVNGGVPASEVDVGFNVDI